jgi:hypothetical protein
MEYLAKKHIDINIQWREKSLTRFELNHNKQKSFSWKGPIFFIIICIFIIISFFMIHHYFQSTIRIDEPAADMGLKVVVHLPKGQEVYTYDKLIVEKNGKTYYKGERNTIDLTGGTVTYEDWK